MADAICRWRNGTPETVVELVNSMPHIIMSIGQFRNVMSDKWDGFFRTPYQLACQLGLYCEAEDGVYYPRFDHDITIAEAEEYLYRWFPRYYIPNPYTNKNGFRELSCPVYFVKSLYEYTKEHPNCDYKTAYEHCFKETAKNNDDIIRNYINRYSQVLTFSPEGKLNITEADPNKIFMGMDKNNKKAFFDNFNIMRNDVAIDFKLQQIYYGAPGTGKSHIIKETIADESVVRTTFHPDSDYSTFVGAYKPTTKEVKLRDVSGHVIKEEGKDVTENKIVYEFVSQAFLQAYIQAWKFYAEAVKDGDVKKQFLVIEEINRGNCAQIFGDLFQLLDRNDFGFSDYPIHADNDMQKHLAHAFAGLTIAKEDEINACYRGKDIVTKVLKGELLLLPDNLYIWATMNTSDQSLFPIDSAFKRRWDWQYMPITDGKKGWKIEADGNLYDWWQFLEKMNDKIGSITNSEDKKLGYFFCKTKDGVISAETFVGKVIFYIWNDVFKDFAEESGDLFRDSDGTLLTFNKFYTIGTEGRTEVAEEKITHLFQNLKLESVEEVIEDEDGNSEFSKKRDYSKFSVNGNGKYAKNNLATESIKQYISLNPAMPAETVIANWKSLGYIVPHFVESKEEYDARTDNSKRSSEISCGGTVIYVAHNGYGNNGQVFKLIDAVNKQGWGLTLAKVEE